MIHYRIRTNTQYVKTACARNVPKSEATDSRPDVTCKTCQRYIEEALEAIALEDKNGYSAFRYKCFEENCFEKMWKGGNRG